MSTTGRQPAFDRAASGAVRATGVPINALVALGEELGWLRLASGSVWPATIGHAALNAVAGLPLLLLAGVDPAIGGTIYSPVGWAVLLVAIGWLIRSGRLPRE